MAERQGAYHLYHMQQQQQQHVRSSDQSFWDKEMRAIEAIPAELSAFKSAELPLARIKKIMKLDDDVKTMMIAAEAPLLFSKAAEIFIRELTYRAWGHTERARRRTLQRNDIALSVGDPETDQFDFLIDIVPREALPAPPPPPHSQQQQQQQQALQDPATPAVTNSNNSSVSASSSSDNSQNKSSSASSSASSGIVTSAAAAGIQYVIQLPVSAAANPAAALTQAQPMQIFIGNQAAPGPGGPFDVKPMIVASNASSESATSTGAVGHTAYNG